MHADVQRLLLVVALTEMQGTMFQRSAFNGMDILYELFGFIPQFAVPNTSQTLTS